MYRVNAGLHGLYRCMVEAGVEFMQELTVYAEVNGLHSSRNNTVYAVAIKFIAV
jgi:hypothetical protein